MKHLSFFEAAVNTIHPESKNKKNIARSWMKKTDNILPDYKEIEHKLGISLNIFDHTHNAIHQTSNLKKKHANLLMLENDHYKPIVMTGGNFDKITDVSTKSILQNVVVNLEEYVKAKTGIINENLNDLDMFKLEVLIQTFLPHKKELQYVFAVLPNVNEHIIEELKEDSIIKELMEASKKLMEEKTIGMQGGNKQSIISLMNYKVTMSLQNFLKMIVMICFICAIVLNPLLRYSGFNRLLELQGSMTNNKIQLILPNFYANDYFSKQDDKKTMRHEIVLFPYDRCYRFS